MKERDISAIFYAIAAAVFYALNVPCPTIITDSAEGRSCEVYL